MVKIKILAILIFIFGIFCTLFSAYMFFNLESTLLLWESLQQAGMEGAQKVSRADLRTGIITAAIWYAVIGLLSAISGIGIYLLKNWARQLWLGILLVLAGVSFYWLASEYQKGILDAADLIGYLVIGILLAAMWFYFTRSKTRSLFVIP
jgi:hypothetical protein